MFNFKGFLTDCVLDKACQISLLLAFSLLFVRDGCLCHFTTLLFGLYSFTPSINKRGKWQRHPFRTNNNENAENNDIWNASSNIISYNTCEIRQKFSVRDGLTYFTFKPIEF